MLKFKWRGFVSLVTTFSFLISLVSGIVLYFTPQGKIANWTHWTFWGLDKHTWGAMHINSSLIFFIVIIFHIFYNWKLLVGYMKKRAQMAINLKLELAVTTILSLFVILASIYNYQPFGTIMKWNEDVKSYWADRAYAQPPMPHAEELSVKKFCDKFGIELETFYKNMEQKGWPVKDDSQLLSDLAKNYNISPADIHSVVSPKTGNGQGGGNGVNSSGRGWGRKTVAIICAETNIDVNTALARLSSKGIKASNNSSVKDLAARLKVRPSEIVEFITAQKMDHDH